MTGEHVVNLFEKWPDITFVAFDTETTGAYPLSAELVEVGAVKWKNGQIIDKFQTLLRPTQPMTDFIIGIHGITNEMVQEAPLIKDQISNIRDFFGDCVLMAHHAPFDLGFIAYEFEKHSIEFPRQPVLCTSLLSRLIIHESPNHKLQTLAKVLGIPSGQAHRAYDDAYACLMVGMECFRRLGESTSLGDIYKKQFKNLDWKNYSVFSGESAAIIYLAKAILEKKTVSILYSEKRDDKIPARQIKPIGLVRNPDGDYVMAICLRDMSQKRFYISKIQKYADYI